MRELQKNCEVGYFTNNGCFRKIGQKLEIFLSGLLVFRKKQLIYNFEALIILGEKTNVLLLLISCYFKAVIFQKTKEIEFRLYQYVLYCPRQACNLKHWSWSNHALTLHVSLNFVLMRNVSHSAGREISDYFPSAQFVCVYLGSPEWQMP